MAFVTVMFYGYFGIPQQVLRTGLWAKMKPSEQNLYVCLMHESERYSTRQITRSDMTLCALSGLSSRAFCNARKRLQEFRLIECRRGRGNVYRYTICNPETGLPWPGNPKQLIQYRRRNVSAGAVGNDGFLVADRDAQNPQAVPPTLGNPCTKSHGIPLKFQ